MCGCSRGRVRSGWILVVALGLLFSATSSFAGITFEKTYGGLHRDEGLSVDQTSDGGYIVTGHVNWGDYLYLIKTDSLGDTLWTRTYGSDSVESKGRSVRETDDGGYFVVGYMEPGPHGYGDIPVWKFDPDGDLEWEKSFGSPAHEGGYGGQQTTDGGYIIVGCTGTSQLGNQAYLIKTNSSGDSLWSRMLGFPYNTAGRSVQQTQDGGYIVAGSAFLDEVHGLLLMKTSSAGWPQWQKFHDLTPLWEYARSVQQTTDGGYVVTGYSGWAYLENSQVFLLKTDVWGEEVWTRFYEKGAFADWGHSVCQTYDGGYVIAGCTDVFAPGARDAYLIKTDSLGVVIWDTVFGTPGWDEGKSVQQTADGGYIVAGMAEGRGADVYLVKVDERGQVIPQRDAAVVSIDAPADTVFTGTWCEPMATLRSYGNTIDSAGATASIDGYAETVENFQLLPGGSLQVHFPNWFVPSADSTTYTMIVCARVPDDIDTTNDCMQKEIFAYNPTGVEEGLNRPSGLAFHLWQNEPNPFRGSTVIQYSLPFECDVTLSVYDVTGSQVDELIDGRQGPGIYRIQWDGGIYASGIYFILLKTGKHSATRKMIVAR